MVKTNKKLPCPLSHTAKGNIKKERGKAQDPELRSFNLLGTRRPRMTVKHPGMTAVYQAQRPPVQVRAGQKAPRQIASK